MTTDQEELFGLFESLCDGVITPAEHGRLQQRLGADAAARQFYFDYLDLRLHLRQWQQTCAGERSLGIEAADAIPPGPIVMQDPPLHAPVSAIYSPMGSFAFSYLVAALIVGVGLMIGWVYHVPNPRADRGETAKVGPPPAPQELSSPPEMVIVGRVTGMIDCQWADAKTATTPSAPVFLGSKYDLVSGLLNVGLPTRSRLSGGRQLGTRFGTDRLTDGGQRAD